MTHHACIIYSRMITVAFYLIASDDMKKELDTTPLLDILDRRKSMQDAVVWARRALQRIRPGVYRRSTRWSIELSRVALKTHKWFGFVFNFTIYFKVLFIIWLIEIEKLVFLVRTDSSEQTQCLLVQVLCFFFSDLLQAEERWMSAFIVYMFIVYMCC